MAQFDIFTNSNSETRNETPYLLDLQVDLLQDLATRLVAPLRPKRVLAGQIITKLHPVVSARGVEHVVVISEMAAVSAAILGRYVDTARGYRTDIIAAIDLLITGF
ncbi:MAG: plasmid maintenance protein CcdB [Spirochaetes bacterium]|jgi:toxin CcdB|nr:plasmid maintenance protein CcdB [Spirochaetota bacterium]